MSKSEPLRIRLSKTKTPEELQQMIFDIHNDPESKEGIVGNYILNAKARKMIDEITWAMYYQRGNAQKTVNARHDMTPKNW